MRFCYLDLLRHLRRQAPAQSHPNDARVLEGEIAEYPVFYDAVGVRAAGWGGLSGERSQTGKGGRTLGVTG
jgi:hypothetical protein